MPPEEVAGAEELTKLVQDDACLGSDEGMTWLSALTICRPSKWRLTHAPTLDEMETHVRVHILRPAKWEKLVNRQKTEGLLLQVSELWELMFGGKILRFVCESVLKDCMMRCGIGGQLITVEIHEIHFQVWKLSTNND